MHVVLQRSHDHLLEYIIWAIPNSKNDKKGFSITKLHSLELHVQININ